VKKLFTLLFSTITIFALVSCNDVDTSSTTSVVTPSSSIITPSSNSDTSSLETSSIEITSSVEESSRVEESSSESSIQTYYHVKFVNYDDSLLYEVDVLEGSAATYVGETPTREGTDTVTYSFKGWDKSYSSVTSDLTVVATYYSISEDTESGWGPIR
jgi:hypothetical protein